MEQRREEGDEINKVQIFIHRQNLEEDLLLYTDGEGRQSFVGGENMPGYRRAHVSVEVHLEHCIAKTRACSG